MLSSIAHPLRIALPQRDQDIIPNGSLHMEKKTRETWEKFYEQYSRSFWFYIFKVCGDEQTADDVFQESFCKFLKAKIEFQNEKHMQAYLYRIAYRLIIDKARRIKVAKKAYMEEQLAYGKDGPKKDPQSDLHFSLDMENTFKKLKPKERTLLWLAHVEEYSYKEIAEMTGMRESSIKVQLFRARGKLASILKKQNFEEE